MQALRSGRIRRPAHEAIDAAGLGALAKRLGIGAQGGTALQAVERTGLPNNDRQVRRLDQPGPLALGGIGGAESSELRLPGLARRQVRRRQLGRRPRAALRSLAALDLDERAERDRGGPVDRAGSRERRFGRRIGPLPRGLRHVEDRQQPERGQTQQRDAHVERPAPAPAQCDRKERIGMLHALLVTVNDR